MAAFTIMPPLSAYTVADAVDLTNDWLKTVFPGANPATPLRINEAANAAPAERRRLFAHHSERALDEAILDVCRILRHGNPGGYPVQTIIENFPENLHYRMGPTLAAYDGPDNLQRRAWYASFRRFWRMFTENSADAPATLALLRDMAEFIIDTRGGVSPTAVEWDEAKEFLGM